MRSRERTRTPLISAAQSFLATGAPTVSTQELTDSDTKRSQNTATERRSPQGCHHVSMVGSQVAEWVFDRARTMRELGLDELSTDAVSTGIVAGFVPSLVPTDDVTVDLIDLADVALPFLDEPEHASTRIYTHQHTRDWSARIDRLDAVVIVTPEYNGSFPAPLKNALDFLSEEWNRKPVAVIGYGGTSAGTRAVQALLPVIVSLGMVPAGAVYLPLRARLDEGLLATTGHDAEGLDELLAGLIELARILRPAPVLV